MHLSPDRQAGQNLHRSFIFCFKVSVTDPTETKWALQKEA